MNGPTRTTLVASLLLLASCGGGGGGSDAPAPVPVAAPAPAPPPALVGTRVSPATTLAVACNGTQVGTLYRNAEVEPSLAVDPLDANNIVATWQQDRWSNGGSQGIVNAVTFDGGATWSTRAYPFSRCAGGTAANGGDFDRASNPWVTFSPNGTAHQLALTFTGTVFGAGSESAMLVARSTDRGATWGASTTLIRSPQQFFNDKGAITADPRDARYVYATWDRLVAAGGGPTLFARSVDNGATWSTATSIYDPGTSSQTIGNVIVVLPDGSLVDLLTQIDFAPNGTQSAAFLAVIRSADHGVTWSRPTRIADLLAIGTRDPQTGATVRDAALLGEIAADTSGNLVVVWQDARFSGGVRDAIAFSRSTDGGATWSSPVAINGAPTAAAFDPVAAVRGDGVIGVLYYDLRDDTSDASTLLTGLWLARSADAGRTWTEARVAGPFDVDLAPRTDAGFFLGDYEALGVATNRFVTLFVVTNAGDLANRTDVQSSNPTFIARTDAVLEAATASRTDVPEITNALRARSGAAILSALRNRRPGTH